VIFPKVAWWGLWQSQLAGSVRAIINHPPAATSRYGGAREKTATLMETNTWNSQPNRQFWSFKQSRKNN